jgi:hypothetical protein
VSRIEMHPARMRRVALRSRAIISAGYDAEALRLEIEFRSGRVYRYSGVPQGIWEFLQRSASKGGYINRMIDGHYPHTDITPLPPEQDLQRALAASLSERSEPHE